MSEEFPSQSITPQGPQLKAVTQGRARKMPLGRRAKEAFFPGSPGEAFGSVIWDVFLPAAKDMLFDGLQEGFQRLIFGESRGVYRRTLSNTSNVSRVNRHSPDRALGFKGNERMSDQGRRNQDLTEIVIDSRVEAEHVLDQMNQLIDQYDVCTLADFYTLVGQTTAHTDFKFGWESLGNAVVRRFHDGYIIDMPRPVQIKS